MASKLFNHSKKVLDKIQGRIPKIDGISSAKRAKETAKKAKLHLAERARVKADQLRRTIGI